MTNNPTTEREHWHLEIFEEAEQAASFLNHVELRPEQMVSLQMQVLGPTTQRILVTCRLSSAQLEARIEWLAVERTIHPPVLAVATGGGH